MAGEVVLPVPTDTPDTTIRVPLDGVDFIIHLVYHEREDRWYMDLSTTENARIVAGIKLVCNWPLLRRLVDPRRPLGNLMVLRAVGDAPPGFADLGRSCLLVYIPNGSL